MNPTQCAVCGGEQDAPGTCGCVEKLDAFRQLQQQELVANIGKGGRTAWRKYTTEFLVAQVFDHAAKLAVAVTEHTRRDQGRKRPMPWGNDVQKNVREFAADTANMCFMLLDRLGMLDGEPPFIVADEWPHVFPRSGMMSVRWVLDSRIPELICAQGRHEWPDGPGEWRPLREEDRADLEDSLLNGNDILTTAPCGGARRQSAPPAWMAQTPDGDPLITTHQIHRCTLCGFETEDAEDARAHAREVPPKPDVIGKWVHYNGRSARVASVSLASRHSHHVWLLWLDWQGPFKDSDHYHPDEQSTNYIEHDESLRITDAENGQAEHAVP